MQTPDTKPGAYYVSAVDAGRTALLFGPFIDDHGGALAAVDRVRKVACDLDPRAQWYAFGTVRLYDRSTYPLGSLNNLEQLT
jgi:hypothetical protein